MKRLHKNTVTVAVIALVIAGISLWLAKGHQQAVPAVGGLEMSPGLLISVPLFRQYDERWADELMGTSGSRMGPEGSAVCAVAMLFCHYGIDVDPKILNTYLSDNGGYTERGWILWAKAAEFTQGEVEFAYAGAATHGLIDSYLRQGNPVVPLTLCATLPGLLWSLPGNHFRYGGKLPALWYPPLRLYPAQMPHLPPGIIGAIFL